MEQWPAGDAMLLDAHHVEGPRAVHLTIRGGNTNNRSIHCSLGKKVCVCVRALALWYLRCRDGCAPPEGGLKVLTITGR